MGQRSRIPGTVNPRRQPRYGARTALSALPDGDFRLADKAVRAPFVAAQSRGVHLSRPQFSVQPILPVAIAAGLRNSLSRGTSHRERDTRMDRLEPTAAIDMQLAIQLALFLDNKPGTLARVCDALSAAKINIYAISTSDTVDHSVVRMVVSDPRKALLLFEEHGTLVVETDVLLIEGDNKPGSLAKICHKLAAAKINIEYAYCATPPDARKGLLILRVNNARKAMKVLNT